MNAAEILSAVRQAGATLRVEGDSLVASYASRLAPELKAAIRENKPQIITALAKPICRVTIVEIPATGLRYRRTFAHLHS
jgi:TubC N-terminal docking domain